MYKTLQRGSKVPQVHASINCSSIRAAKIPYFPMQYWYDTVNKHLVVLVRRIESSSSQNLYKEGLLAQEKVSQVEEALSRHP